VDIYFRFRKRSWIPPIWECIRTFSKIFTPKL